MCRGVTDPTPYITAAVHSGGVVELKVYMYSYNRFGIYGYLLKGVCVMYLLPKPPFLDSVAESVEHRILMRRKFGFGSLNPSRIKPGTYKIDTCWYLAWRCGSIEGVYVFI